MGSRPSKTNDPLQENVKPSRLSQLECKSRLQRPPSSLSTFSKASFSPFSVLPPVTNRNEISSGRPASGSRERKTSRHRHSDEERIVYLPDARNPLPDIGNTSTSNEGSSDTVKATNHKSSSEGRPSLQSLDSIRLRRENGPRRHRRQHEQQGGEGLEQEVADERRHNDGYNFTKSVYYEEELKRAIEASLAASSIVNQRNDDPSDPKQSDEENASVDSSQSDQEEVERGIMKVKRERNQDPLYYHPTELYWNDEEEEEEDEKHDENEEEDHDPDISLLSERSIEDILSEMRENFNDSGYITLCINRSCVWKSALEQFHQANFSPADGFEVNFIDDEGNVEGATDAGGPKREYLQLMMDHLANCSLFEGPSGRKLLSYDVQANRRNEYFYAGMVIGQSLLYKGPVPRFLSTLLLDCLILEPENVRGSREDIYDSDWLQLLDEVQKTDCLRDFVLNHSTTLHLAGCLRDEKMENKDQLIQDLINYYLVERTRPAFDKFKQGLDSVGVYYYILRYPDQFRELFCRQEPLTAEKMSAMFTVCYSYIYSQEKEEEETEGEEGEKGEEIDANVVIEVEQKTVEFWENYLHIVVAGCSQVNLEDIMMFTTGMREQPCGQYPKIYFNHSYDGEPASKYPRSSTCSCVLYLPLHETFEEFKEAMDFGILNGNQFGYT